MLAALEAHCAGGGRVLAIGKLVPKRVAAWRGALVVPSASHAAVFPRCACVIHHGGAGTAAAAVRARVPSLAVPHLTWIDQVRWGKWIADHAAGVLMAEHARSAADFTAALHAVLHDRRLQAGAAALADALDADGGVDLAVRLIGERAQGGGGTGGVPSAAAPRAAAARRAAAFSARPSWSRSLAVSRETTSSLRRRRCSNSTR